MNTKRKLIAPVVALAAIAGVLPAAAGAILPGDTGSVFWPHEAGVSVGTSETYVDLRDDGSYFDPSVQRRVGLVAAAGRAGARGPSRWCPEGLPVRCEGANDQPRFEPGQVRPRVLPTMTVNAYGRQAWRSGGWLME